jgi:oligosaccharide repeat unit polymerase
MEEAVLQFGLYYVFFSVILFLLFRKYILSVFDPFVFIILMMSSSLCLTVDSSFFLYVLLAVLFFFFGFRLVGVPKRNFVKIDEFIDTKLLEIFTILFFILYVIVSVIMFKSSGIPLLSENPTEAKISMFVEGTGWIRRIIFLSGFLPICISLLLIVSKKKIFYSFMFFLYLLISVMHGSKGGLIGTIAIFWYLYQQNNLWSDSTMYVKNFIRSKIKYFLVITVLLFLSIVMKESEIEGQDPIFSIGFRLMEFGDVMLYYKTQVVRDYFVNFNFVDFILYEFNGILGMLRLTPYYEPLGYQMVKAFWNTSSLFDDVVLGPNTVFFVKGHVFFGYIGGIVYSFLMGVLSAHFRKKIIEIKIKNIFMYAIAVYVFFQIPGFLKEFSQSVSTVFDFVFYLGPIILFSLILKEGLKKVDNIKNVN